MGEDCFVSTPEYPFTVTTLTGADGAFRIPKIDGVERLEVVHPAGWGNVAVAGRLGEAIRLQPWGHISGVVASGQSALAGVEVQATAAGTKPEQMLFEFSTRSDADGHFEFPKVPAGLARVSVLATEGAQATGNAIQEIRVVPGRAVDLSLSLPTR